MSFENWNRFLQETIADLQADAEPARGSRRNTTEDAQEPAESIMRDMDTVTVAE